MISWLNNLVGAAFSLSGLSAAILGFVRLFDSLLIGAILLLVGALLLRVASDWFCFVEDES